MSKFTVTMQDAQGARTERTITLDSSVEPNAINAVCAAAREYADGDTGKVLSVAVDENGSVGGEIGG